MDALRLRSMCARASLALALALVLVGGCSSREEPPQAAATAQASAAPKPAPVRGGTAVLGSISDVDSWNPYVSQQAFANNVLRRIFLRLAAPRGDESDAPQEHVPQLAESWVFSDDRLDLTFLLREATWSDGRPITAADVRFTWLAQTAPDVPWANAPTKRHIKDVEVEDQRRVTFHFDRSYPYQLADAVEGVILPEHVFGVIPFAEWATHDWSTLRVGSGPFLLAQHEAGQQIVLERNPRYYETGYPLLDRVVVRIVPDAANLVTQLVAGEIDYLEGLSPDDAHRLAGSGDVAVVSFDYPNYDFIGWNGARAPFDDPELRRALTLAIDRRALVEELLYGYGRVSKGPLLSFWWSANDALEPWPYDPAEARRILERAGYATGAAAKGKALHLELITNAGNRVREQMLVKIQAQLAQVGVEAEVAVLEMRALRQRVGAGDFDGYLGGWVFDGKADLRALFASDALLPHGMNVVHYSSEEVDRLLAEADSAEDWRLLKPKLDAVQDRIHADQPYTFLYEARRVAAHTKRLGGVTIDVPSDPLAALERCWVN